jgi:putative transposase
MDTKKYVSAAVLHSDQGFQYTSQAYHSRLEEFSVKGSHFRKGICLDNACIESFFSQLKTEKLYLHQCKSEAEIHQAVEEYIYFYNFKQSSNSAHRWSTGTRWQLSLF